MYEIEKSALDEAWLFFRHAAWMHRNMEDSRSGRSLPQWIGPALPAPRRQVTA
jgi:hypothetical protein